jgi:hypothetical protein
MRPHRRLKFVAKQYPRPLGLALRCFLRFLRAVNIAVPPFLETFTAVMAAFEHGPLLAPP